MVDSMDAYVVMPNHVHGIVVFVRGGRRGVWPYAPTSQSLFRSPSHTIGAVVRGFKGAVTKRLNQIRGTPGAPFWERNYYEHIIRGGDGLNRIRQYIEENPARWAEDENNPDKFLP